MTTKVILQDTEDFKFNNHCLVPFITSKRFNPKKDKEDTYYEDTKRAINMKDSVFLEVVMDDYGFKVVDNEEKGFCIKWDNIEEIKALNNIHTMLEIETEDDMELADLFLDKLANYMFESVLKAIKE